MAVPLDAVDQIKAQWQQERPELSLQAMGILGRLRRCAVLYAPLSDSSFGKFGLTAWEFDVLATLRRAGAPYTLTPTELFSTLMVTSGTMTHRLKGLETRAFIERSDNLDDARNRLVTLSLQGLSTIDAAMRKRVRALNKANTAHSFQNVSRTPTRLDPGVDEVAMRPCRCALCTWVV